MPIVTGYPKTSFGRAGTKTLSPAPRHLKKPTVMNTGPAPKNAKAKQAKKLASKQAPTPQPKPLSKAMPSGKGPAQPSKIPKKGQNVLKGRGSLTYDA